jgi:protein-S-isoprenylcysteine O-methyltransferase Ste14
MSLIPAFEIGVWNAWIFMAAWVVFHMVPLTWPIFRYDIKAFFRKGSASPQYSKAERAANNIGMLVWYILLAYSVFLPLPLGTPLLYTGTALFAAGLIIVEIAEIPWAKTALDKPITTGIYRYSRHPIYIGVFVQYIGIGIASASGLFLLLIIIQIALSAYTTPAEERFCLEKYGNAYREYMKRTPRWLGLPKS